MPKITAALEIDASPESVWRVLMALERWPNWSPLFQMVQLHEAALGIAGGFRANGLVGRVPYRAEFMVPIHEPLQRVVFETVNVSTPFNVLWHDIRLSGRRLSWSITYTTAGGPGGFLVDRLLIRRPAQGLIERGLAALDEQVHT